MKNTSGNALFLILIAVALFAALSYAITSSGRGGGNINKEQAQILAAQLTQHTARMRSAVQRLMLLNGCADTDLAFYSASGPYMGDHAYPTPDETTIKPECNLYDPDGGGLTSEYVPDGIGLLEDNMQSGFQNEDSRDRYTRSYLPTRMYVKDVGTNFVSSGDTHTSEIGIGVQMTSREVCLAINNGLGVENPGGEPPTNASISINFAAGSCDIKEDRTCSYAHRSDWIPELDNLYDACFYNPNPSSWINAPRYTYYSVMHAG